MPHSFLQTDATKLQASIQDANRQLQETAAIAQAKSFGLPYVNLHNFPVDLQVLALFSEETAKNAESIPFYREQKDLRIGTRNPNNPLLQEKIKEFSGKYRVTLYGISVPSFNQALQFYKKVATPKHIFSEVIRVTEAKDYLELLKSLQTEAQQKQASASEIIAAIFAAAMYVAASDIHCEPEEQFVRVRFRIDGVLQDMLYIHKDLQKSLTSRLKILAKLKLNVENVPQDGRITFYYLQKAVDVRVSSLPSVYGEAFVMRLLGTGEVGLKLKDLGFTGKSAECIASQLEKPNGMIITTGPTGSGKTTTLYAFLNELNQPRVKIITLEDPVEYKLEGIQQTPIDHNVDFNFAKGLRAILRQDPDIIMVGEIRDQETAETALQAALTGHTVFSTLHTNDASGAIPRLYHMGVKPFVIAPAVNAIIAQRLVRKLCGSCIAPAVLSPSMLTKVNQILAEIPAAAQVVLPEVLQFYHSSGCEACHGLGYKGRTGVYEVMEVANQLKEAILAENSTAQLKIIAVNQGMLSMAQDGILKALQKITDLEEVFRVTGG